MLVFAYFAQRLAETDKDLFSGFIKSTLKQVDDSCDCSVGIWTFGVHIQLTSLDGTQSQNP